MKDRRIRGYFAIPVAVICDVGVGAKQDSGKLRYIGGDIGDVDSFDSSPSRSLILIATQELNQLTLITPSKVLRPTEQSGCAA